MKEFFMNVYGSGAKEAWRFAEPYQRSFVLLCCCLIAVLLICVNCCTGLRECHDSYAEEILEDVIKTKTGMDIDLTPRSPESP